METGQLGDKIRHVFTSVLRGNEGKDSYFSDHPNNVTSVSVSLPISQVKKLRPRRAKGLALEVVGPGLGVPRSEFYAPGL